MYLLQWESSPDNANWQTASSGPSTIYNPGVLSSTTYFRTILSAGVCPAVTSNSIVIVIENPILQNTILANQTICSGQPTSLISGFVPTGGSGLYQYSWQSSPTNAVWSNLIGSTLSDYNPGSLLSMSYFRRIVTSGVCQPSTSTSLMVQVDPIIINNTIGSAQTICPGASPLAFTGSLPAGGLGTYGYQWESS